MNIFNLYKKQGYHFDQLLIRFINILDFLYLNMSQITNKQKNQEFVFNVLQVHAQVFTQVSNTGPKYFS